MRQIVRDWVERSMPRVWLNLLTARRTVDLYYWLQEEHRVTRAKRGGLLCWMTMLPEQATGRRHRS
jgi:hypothetical protein